MKKRSAEILYRLVEAPSHRLRLQALIDDYRISDKTLRADIASVQAYARAADGSSLVQVTDHHLQLAPGVAASDVAELLDMLDLYEYRLSLDERKYLICANLLALDEGQWLTAQGLADEMYVTRNTVIADTKIVDTYLAGHGIELVSKSKYGMQVRATAGQRRALLIDIFSDLLGTCRSRNDFFTSLLVRSLGLAHSAVDITDSVRSFLRMRNVFISIEAEHEISACLLVMLGKPALRPTETGRAQGSDTEDTADRQQLDIIGELVNYVSEHLDEQTLPPASILYMEQVILSRNLLPQIKRFDDFDLYCAISHFLLLVGRGLDMDIQNDNLLIEALLSHIKSMTDWDSDAFEVNISGPSGAMVGMVQIAAEPHFHVLEDYLHRQMNASMRSSVIIHICAALYRNESNARPCRVVIACPSSVATSKYLEAQIKSYFNFDIVDVVAVHDIRAGKVCLDGVDFIISTVAIDDMETAVLVVSPVLAIEDINRIQAFAFRRARPVPGSGGGSSILARLYEVYASGNHRKIAYLNRELTRVLQDVGQIERRTMAASPLLKMLDQRYMRLEEEPCDWRTGIRLAARSLMEDGCFSEGYVEKAIANVEEYGSYIIVNQGIALAHAGSQDGVARDGLGLLISKRGIEFDGGEKVYLLFFFSQVSDTTDRLDLFREIIRLGNDQSSLDRMREVADIDAAYQCLVEVLTDYA